MLQAIGTSSSGSPAAVRMATLSTPSRRYRRHCHCPTHPALTTAFILRPTATRYPEAEARKSSTPATTAAAAAAPFTLRPTATHRPKAEARKNSTTTAPRTPFILCLTAVPPMPTLSTWSKALPPLLLMLLLLLLLLMVLARAALPARSGLPPPSGLLPRPDPPIHPVLRAKSWIAG